MSDSVRVEPEPLTRKGKGLPPEAYEEIPGTQYEPYVPATTRIAEFTLRAVLIGIVVGIVFGAANAYLGLKVGLTVSASIPAAVMAVAVFRALRRGTILEGNIVQTVGSAGESLAAGVIFTIPALFIFGLTPSQLMVFTLASLGGLLGVLFMIPLRRYLIRDEHGRLPYPEGTACAEVLAAGDSGGAKAKLLFGGLGVGAVYQYLANSNALSLWRGEPAFRIQGYPKAEVGIAVTPELLGVGYVIGPRIAAILLTGGVIGWLVIIPLIATFGASATAPLYPETERLIPDMEPGDLWNRYIRYVGAGAVAFGGIITLLRAIPTIWQSFRLGFRGIRETAGTAEAERTDQDISFKVVVGGALAIAVALALLPPSFAPVGLLGALLMVVFSFFFVTVSSRIVGLIGNSSNPISGMTIATLLVTAFLFVAMGKTGAGDQRVAILLVGAVIAISAAVAGDTSQDLKTGFLLGATPRLQQYGEMIGVVTSATVMGAILLVLHGGLGIGSEDLPAPQATLMALVIDGVVNADLPWALVIAGAFIAAVFEMLGLPSLALAVGLYLPLSLTTPIMAGGVVRLLVEKRNEGRVLREKRENGVLFASGLIAGAALVGVLIAGLVFGAEQSAAIAGYQAAITGVTEGAGTWVSLVIFAGLACLLWYFAEHGHSGGEITEDLRQADEM
ncbi:MAG TPA: oligopeptide transporter, OPT family [Gemmatimonadota bacterium]|nr:oligopeptide transporter, OPT family [Gemmatimonadota bacterium]